MSREDYEELAIQIANEYNIHPAFFSALIEQESNWDPNAVSRADARGLTQTMPLIQKAFGIEDPHDPEQSMRGSARFLDELFNKYGDDKAKVLAAYNAGEPAVNSGRWKDFPETTNYVDRITNQLMPSYKERYGNLTNEVQQSQAVPQASSVGKRFTVILPDGTRRRLPQNVPSSEAEAWMRNKYPESFETPSGFFPGLFSSWENYKGAVLAAPAATAAGSEFLGGSRESRESLLESAKQTYQEYGEKASEILPDPASAESIGKTYEEEGLWGATGETVDFIKQSIGQQIPIYGAFAAGKKIGSAKFVQSTVGRAGTALASRLIPAAAAPFLPAAFSNPWTGTAAGLAVAAAFAYTTMLQDSAEKAEDVDDIKPLRVAAYTAPHAALNYIGFAMTGAFGPLKQRLAADTLKATLAGASTKTGRSAWKAAGKQGAESLSEFPTELAQTVIERAQRGDSISLDDANFVTELIETAAATAPVIGAFGGYGSYRSYRKEKADIAKFESDTEQEKAMRESKAEERRKIMDQDEARSVRIQKENEERFTRAVGDYESMDERIAEEALAMAGREPVYVSDVIEVFDSRGIDSSSQGANAFLLRNTNGDVKNLHGLKDNKNLSRAERTKRARYRRRIHSILSGMRSYEYDGTTDVLGLNMFTQDQFFRAIEGTKNLKKIGPDDIRRILAMGNSKIEQRIASKILNAMKERGYATRVTRKDKTRPFVARNPGYNEVQYDEILRQGRESGRITQEMYEKVTNNYGKEQYDLFVADMRNRRDIPEVDVRKGVIVPILNEVGIGQVDVGVESKSGYFIKDGNQIVGGATDIDEANELLERMKKRTISYSVLRNGETVATLKNSTEATGYLNDLKERDPEAAWERKTNPAADLKLDKSKSRGLRVVERFYDENDNLTDIYEDSFVPDEDTAAKRIEARRKGYEPSVTAWDKRSGKTQRKSFERLAEQMRGRGLFNKPKREDFQTRDSRRTLDTKEDNTQRENMVLESIRTALDGVGLTGIAAAIDQRIGDKTGEAFAAFDSSRRAISVALDKIQGAETQAEIDEAIANSVSHELIHALRELDLFTPGEWLAISRAVARVRVGEGQRQKYREAVVKLKEENPDLSEFPDAELPANATYWDWATAFYGQDTANMTPQQANDYLLEEAVAQMYADSVTESYVSDQITGQTKSLLDRIKLFLERLYNSISGLGYGDAGDVFAAIGKGSIGTRNEEIRTIRSFGVLGEETDASRQAREETRSPDYAPIAEDNEKAAEQLINEEENETPEETQQRLQRESLPIPPKLITQLKNEVQGRLLDQGKRAEDYSYYIDFTVPSKRLGVEIPYHMHLQLMVSDLNEGQLDRFLIERETNQFGETVVKSMFPNQNIARIDFSFTTQEIPDSDGSTLLNQSNPGETYTRTVYPDTDKISVQQKIEEVKAGTTSMKLMTTAQNVLNILATEVRPMIISFSAHDRVMGGLLSARERLYMRTATKAAQLGGYNLLAASTSTFNGDRSLFDNLNKGTRTKDVEQSSTNFALIKTSSPEVEIQKEHVIDTFHPDVMGEAKSLESEVEKKENIFVRDNKEELLMDPSREVSIAEIRQNFSGTPAENFMNELVGFSYPHPVIPSSRIAGETAGGKTHEVEIQFEEYDPISNEDVNDSISITWNQVTTKEDFGYLPLQSQTSILKDLTNLADKYGVTIRSISDRSLRTMGVAPELRASPKEINSLLQEQHDFKPMERPQGELYEVWQVSPDGKQRQISSRSEYLEIAQDRVKEWQENVDREVRNGTRRELFSTLEIVSPSQNVMVREPGVVSDSVGRTTSISRRFQRTSLPAVSPSYGEEFANQIFNETPGFIPRISTRPARDLNVRPEIEDREALTERQRKIARGEIEGLKFSRSDINQLNNSRRSRTLPPDIQKIQNRVSPETKEKSFFDYIKMLWDSVERTKFFTKLRQDYIDKYESISKLARRANDMRKMNRQDQLLLADVNSASAAYLSDKAIGIVSESVTSGQPVYRDGRTYVDYEKQGLFQILKDVYQGGHIHLWHTWMIHRRENRFEKDRGFVVGSTSEERTKIDNYVRENGLLELFERTNTEYQKWNENLVEFMKDTGIVDSELGEVFKSFGDYIPFYRVFEGEASKIQQEEMAKLMGQSVQSLRNTINPETGKPYLPAPVAQSANPIPNSMFGSLTGAKAPKAAKGGSGLIVDPLEAMMMNLQAAVTSGMKNVAAQRVMRDAEYISENAKPGEEILVTRVKKGEGNKTIRVNGEEVEFLVHDQLLFDSLSGMMEGRIGWMSLFSGPSTVLREMVTRSPDFIVANLLRDSISTWVASGTNMKPFLGTFNQFFKGGIAGRGQVSDSMKQLVGAGIVGGYDYGIGSKGAKKLFAERMRQSGMTVSANKGNAAMVPIKKIWDWAGDVTTKSDAATRAAVYEDVYKTLINKGHSVKEAEAEAIFQAGEILNFSRRGRSGLARFITTAIPFLNARVQGLDLLYRAGRSQYSSDYSKLGAKRNLISMLTRGAMIASLTGMYAMLVHDDEEWKSASEQEKDDYWILPSFGGMPSIRIPIPFEVGVLFKVMPERFMRNFLAGDTELSQLTGLSTPEEGYADNRQTADSIKRAIISTFEINPFEIQATKPILEVMMNHSFFTGRPIIPPYMTDDALLPERQKRPNTAALAVAIADLYGGSPMKVEHLLRGYTGTVGTWVTMALDDSIRTMKGMPAKAELRTDQWPLIRRFLQSDLGASGQLNDFYTFREDVRRIVNSINDLKRTDRDIKGAREMAQENKDIMRVKGMVDNMDKRLKAIRQAQQRVYLSDMSPEEKLKQMNRFDQMRKQTLQRMPELRRMANLPYLEG